ncbi:unnamed protein product [Heligmosomoides polygyrus]|uniref:Monocyte to macrophage differentiation factor n=1 Tax=Heligmosomoides polygyrus TaxID=6339 RepID=A0A3P8DZG4_HELPZ|nr:unnamed protein product [Heligmosomoides polygyrus]
MAPPSLSVEKRLEAKRAVRRMAKVDMVRNVRLDDLPVEYLMACTGLGKECVEAILRNHGFDPSMSGTPVDVETDESLGSDVSTDDESDWDHCDDEGEENSSTIHQNVIHFDNTAVTVDQIKADTGYLLQIADATLLTGMSPREVTDSSAEISDLAKRVRDNATDLPSLDYLSMSELGGLRQIPEAFITQDDVSSSAFSSDQSAGQVPKNLAHPSLYKNKRAGKGEAYEPTTYEHWANTISHAIGIVPCVVVFWHMVTISHRELQFYLMIIYGLFTTLLFSSSTCYHVCELKFRQRRAQTQLRYYLHICDRAAIYLFIAASYTPWLTLRHCGYPGLNLKWMIWVFALMGILYQYNFHEKYKTLETLLYILIAGGPSVAIFTMVLSITSCSFLFLFLPSSEHYTSKS